VSRRAVAAVLLLAGRAWGWNATGHRIASAIAYDLLTGRVRERVDALLATHPDYAALLTHDAPADPRLRARAAFLAASVWPDTIRSDSRFYDDTRENARPTPLLPGFPSMARHTNWHYIDLPISVEGAPTQPPKPPNALTELRRIMKETKSQQTGLIAAYDLPWLIHIEEDVHQPLHSVSRFVKSQLNGDAGGNNVYVTPGRNLHAIWDNAAGVDTSDIYVNRFAAEITAEFVERMGRRPRVSKDPRKWINDGRELAMREVYSFGPNTGTREHPVALTQDYQSKVRRIARFQLALAGFRLAAVLNERFK
jgi:hypothetical protein